MKERLKNFSFFYKEKAIKKFKFYESQTFFFSFFSFHFFKPLYRQHDGMENNSAKSLFLQNKQILKWNKLKIRTNIFELFFFKFYSNQKILYKTPVINETSSIPQDSLFLAYDPRSKNQVIKWLLNWNYSFRHFSIIKFY